MSPSSRSSRFGETPSALDEANAALPAGFVHAAATRCRVRRYCYKQTLFATYCNHHYWTSELAVLYPSHLLVFFLQLEAAVSVRASDYAWGRNSGVGLRPYAADACFESVLFTTSNVCWLCRYSVQYSSRCSHWSTLPDLNVSEASLNISKNKLQPPRQFPGTNSDRSTLSFALTTVRELLILTLLVTANSQ